MMQLTHGVTNGPIPPRLLSDIMKYSSEFLDLVREYNNGEEIYDRLMQILKDYREQRSDVGENMLRIEQLLEDHSELRQGLKRLQLEAKIAMLFADHKDLFLDFWGFLPGGFNLSE